MAVIFLFLALFAQEENPRARHASIYPHPPEPTHLVHYVLDVKIELVKRHWLWTSRTPYQGMVQIQQQRPRGGWWLSANRRTDVNGRLTDTIEVDSTWPQHVLLVLDKNRFIEIDLGKQVELEIDGD